MSHPQFRIIGKVVNREIWPGWQRAVEGVHYVRQRTQVLDHLPPSGEWIYEVIGGGSDHLRCPRCFPAGGVVIDARRAPGA